MEVPNAPYTLVKQRDVFKREGSKEPMEPPISATIWPVAQSLMYLLVLRECPLVRPFHALVYIH